MLRKITMIQILVTCMFLLSCAKEDVKHYNQGLLYHEQGKLDEAIAQFKAAIQLNPLYTEAHNKYMDIMLEKGKNSDIIAEYQAKVQQHPSNEVYYYLLGRALHDTDNQLREYKKAVEINPDYPWGHYGLGCVYLSQEMLGKAVTEYRAVIKIKPNHAESHFNLGNIYTKQDKLDEAISEYETTIKINLNHPDAHYNLAVVYEKVGRFDEAIEAYKNAIRINPDDGAARYNLNKIDENRVR